MEIVIYGLAKTGTSALFYKLKNSLPADTLCLFEPVSRGRISRFREGLKAASSRRGNRFVLAKVLAFSSARPVRLADFATFDKQILIFRDPRDRLVSHLLYKAYDAGRVADDVAVGEHIAALREKEARPRSVSLMRLLQTLGRLQGGAFSLATWSERYRTEAVARPLAFHGERPGIHTISYEDMVDDRYTGLESYLGVILDGSATVSDSMRRVVRSRGYGSWRDWFTPDDVAMLRPILQPYLDRYYPDADWRLSETPGIDPEHGSRYVERIVNERRAGSALPPFASDRR